MIDAITFIIADFVLFRFVFINDGYGKPNI